MIDGLPEPVCISRFPETSLAACIKIFHSRDSIERLCVENRNNRSPLIAETLRVAATWWVSVV